jgi:hypothetical protein
MDWDEELKRQAAISALLAPPEDGQPPLDTQTASASGADEQVTAEPDVLQPDKSEWHKLADQVFPTIAEDQGASDKYPTIASDQPSGPPKDYPNISPPAPEPADIKTDEDTGTRYVQDALEGKIPHAELATAADKEAFKPSDVTLPQVTSVGQDVAPQVRPGEEWREPWHPSVYPTVAQDQGAPPVVQGFVPGSQNAIVNPAAGVTPPTPKPAYPAQIVTPDEASGAKSIVNAPPGTPAAIPAATPTPAATPAPADQASVIQPSTGDWNKLVDSAFPSADSKTKPTASSGVTSTTNPDGTPFPVEQAPNGQAPSTLIIHHTGGRGSPASVVDGWRTERPGVGSQFIMDRDGVIHDTQAEFGYGGTGHFLHSVIPGVNNHTAVGIEVIAKDDADMTDAQLESLKKFAGPSGPYSNVAVYGHSQVSPSDRENEGVRGVAAINEARAAGPTAPTGEPGTTPIETLVKLDQSGLNVTHFGYEKPGEEGYDVDSANGNGKYVKDLIPGYDVALNSAGAALVGNPKPGETFTYAGKEWRYGDAASEKLKDPRFDIFDPSGNALSGGVQLGKQVVATGAASEGPQSIEDIAKDWIRLSPEEQAKIDQGVNDHQTKILSTLQNSTNMPDFVRALEKPIPGVSDEVRQAALDDAKKKITAYAVDYYKEPDAAKAYAKIMEGPNWRNLWGATTLINEVPAKFLPNVAHAGLSIAQAATDSSPLIQFLNVAEPNSSPEARTNLVRQMMAYSGQDRTDFIKHLYSNLGSDQASQVDLNALLNWSDTVAQPGVQAEQAKQQEVLKAAVAQNRKDLRVDPTLSKLGGTIADAIAAAPKNFAEGIVPGIGQSVMASEIYSDTLAGLREDHPDWTEDQLKAKAAAVTVPQSMLQELINLGTLGVGGSALRGIENPVARILTSSIAHGVITAGAGVAQQGVANVAEGKPITQGMTEAGIGAGVQGIVGGAFGARHGAEVKPELGEVHTVVPEPVETPLSRNVVGGGVETAVPSEPTPILTPNRAVRTSDVLGTEPGDQHIVSTTDVLGHQGDYTPEEPLPWFKQGVTPAEQHDPLVIRGAERTTFTPQELSDIINRLPSNATPAEVARVLNSVQSPTGVHLGEESTGEIQRAQAAQEQPSPVQFWKSDKQRTLAEQAWIKANAGEPIGNAIAKARAAASLGETPAAPTTPQAKPSAEKQMRPGPPPPVNGNISGEDPHIVRESNKTTVNGVANRYVAERVAGGELPRTDPNIGVTTEELLARGAKMGPEEINKHVSDLMDGKVNNPRDMAAAVRAKERELTQRSRQLGILSEENPSDASAKLDADNALAKLHDFHSEGGPIKKMKELFNHLGVGLQGDLQYDLSSENGLKEKFFQESKGKKAPPQADPVIKETAARVRRAYSEDYKAKKRVSAEVDKWLGKKMNDQQIEETRQAALKKMNQVPC